VKVRRDHPDAERKASKPAYQRLMSGLERTGASVVGALLGGGGAAAVFITNNQAGSTAMILVGAVFLIIGVQGTPISRASKDSVELRDREVVKTTAEIADKNGPEEAENYLRGAVSADPRLLSVSSVVHMTWELYEMRVRHALERIAFQNKAALTHMDRDVQTVDFTLAFRGNDENDMRAINIVIKYSSTPVSSSYLSRIVQPSLFIPVLLISNSPLSRSGQHQFQTLREFGGFCNWVNESDDGKLAAEIDRVAKMTA
jgi:hypothetical protein